MADEMEDEIDVEGFDDKDGTGPLLPPKDVVVVPPPAEDVKVDVHGKASPRMWQEFGVPVCDWSVDEIDAESRQTIQNMLLEEQKYLGRRNGPISKRAKKKSSSYLRWTPQERLQFEKGFMSYGNRWTQIAKLIPTRSPLQVKNYARYYFPAKDKQTSSTKTDGSSSGPPGADDPVHPHVPDSLNTGSPTVATGLRPQGLHQRTAAGGHASLPSRRRHFQRYGFANLSPSRLLRSRAALPSSARLARKRLATPAATPAATPTATPQTASPVAAPFSVPAFSTTPAAAPTAAPTAAPVATAAPLQKMAKRTPKRRTSAGLGRKAGRRGRRRGARAGAEGVRAPADGRPGSHSFLAVAADGRGAAPEEDPASVGGGSGGGLVRMRREESEDEDVDVDVEEEDAEADGHQAHSLMGLAATCDRIYNNLIMPTPHLGLSDSPPAATTAATAATATTMPSVARESPLPNGPSSPPPLPDGVRDTRPGTSDSVRLPELAWNADHTYSMSARTLQRLGIIGGGGGGQEDGVPTDQDPSGGDPSGPEIPTTTTTTAITTAYLHAETSDTALEDVAGDRPSSPPSGGCDAPPPPRAEAMNEPGTRLGESDAPDAKPSPPDSSIEGDGAGLVEGSLPIPTLIRPENGGGEVEAEPLPTVGQSDGVAASRSPPADGRCPETDEAGGQESEGSGPPGERSDEDEAKSDPRQAEATASPEGRLVDGSVTSGREREPLDPTPEISTGGVKVEEIPDDSETVKGQDDRPSEEDSQLPTGPTQEHELVLDEILELERTAVPEFFCGRPTKTPQRYLQIRNFIYQQWLETKPKYLNKTAVRQGLKNCGDVNSVCRIHDVLESMGAINYGLGKLPRSVPDHRSNNLPQSVATKTNSVRPTRESTRNHKKRDLDLKEDKSKNAKRSADSLPSRKSVRAGSRKVKAAPYDPFKLIECCRFTDEKQAPFHVRIQSDAMIIMDVHSHMSSTEVIGLLGGRYLKEDNVLDVLLAVPCNSISTGMQCEMDPVSQTEAYETILAKDYQVVGWYHSHPAFAANPSVRDIETQSEFQGWFSQGGAPFVGIIVSPCHNYQISQSKVCCLTISKEWSPDLKCRKPYQFDFTVSHSHCNNVHTMNTVCSVVTRFTGYQYRSEMLYLWSRHYDISFLEKMLRSIKTYMCPDRQKGLLKQIEDFITDEFTPDKTLGVIKEER